MLKACLFDLDGVIVDTAKYHYKAWKKLADHLFIDFNEEENEKMKGISRMDSLEMLLALGTKTYSSAEKEKFCAVKNTWYLDYVSSMGAHEILPGIPEFINHLKENGIKVGLGSASKNARNVLDLVNLTQEFETIVDGNDVVNSKPDPEVFLKGADALNCSPNETLVIEDSAKGIDAAISGGFKTLGIGHEKNLGHANLVRANVKKLKTDELNKVLFN